MFLDQKKADHNVGMWGERHPYGQPDYTKTVFYDFPKILYLDYSLEV